MQKNPLLVRGFFLPEKTGLRLPIAARRDDPVQSTANTVTLETVTAGICSMGGPRDNPTPNHDAHDVAAAREDFEHILSHTHGLWEPLRGASIFLTGGTGFVGTWLLAALLRANDEYNLGVSIFALTRNPARFRGEPHRTGEPRCAASARRRHAQLRAARRTIFPCNSCRNRERIRAGRRAPPRYF